MIGIYKITNKLNGKSYIGQSIHCGKRLDEHYKGNQLIDNIMQTEGIENFNFEILKEVNKEELSYWEDYYIIKYGTMIPNGYNKKWNCNKEIRDEIEKRLKKQIEEENTDKEILSVVSNNEIVPKNSIRLYNYLLSISTYAGENKPRFFMQRDFTISKIREALGMHNETIKKYWKILEDNKIIVYEGSISDYATDQKEWNKNFMDRRKFRLYIYSISKELS